MKTHKTKMATIVSGKGYYEIQYLGFRFTIEKQWISGEWLYNQTEMIKQYPETWIAGSESKFKDCKSAIKNRMDDLFRVKY